MTFTLQLNFYYESMRSEIRTMDHPMKIIFFDKERILAFYRKISYIRKCAISEPDRGLITMIDTSRHNSIFLDLSPKLFKDYIRIGYIVGNGLLPLSKVDDLLKACLAAAESTNQGD